MRFIDTLRYHKPTDEERKELNLCSAVERLNLHTLNDILAICGARKGSRFDGQEIQRMIVLEGHLRGLYTELNDLFQKTRKQDEATQFHEIANQYMETFQQLKTFVLAVRAKPALFSQQPMHQEDDEFESKSKTPFPEFLVVLVQKYRRECHAHEWSPSAVSEAPPLASLAHLAAFIASSLFAKSPLTESEAKSVEILLQVIKYLYIRQDTSFELKTHTTQRRLALSIWAFLCTVREFRSIPKDKHFFTTNFNLEF